MAPMLLIYKGTVENRYQHLLKPGAMVNEKLMLAADQCAKLQRQTTILVIKQLPLLHQSAHEGSIVDPLDQRETWSTQ
jgi:hypothetical protein